MRRQYWIVYREYMDNFLNTKEYPEKGGGVRCCDAFIWEKRKWKREDTDEDGRDRCGAASAYACPAGRLSGIRKKFDRAMPTQNGKQKQDGTLFTDGRRKQWSSENGATQFSGGKYRMRRSWRSGIITASCE